jgi:peroxiredoxin
MQPGVRSFNNNVFDIYTGASIKGSSFFVVAVNIISISVVILPYKKTRLFMQVGQKAPSFSLFNTEKQKVSLEDQKGKNVILMFYPLAFTSVCTTQLCTVRDDISRYSNTAATVFGISVDSLFTLAKFKEEQKINFDLLSDFNKEASEAYDVLYETFPAFEMKGVSKRAAFVIDKEGVVQYVEVCPTPGDLPDFKKINEVLAQLN